MQGCYCSASCGMPSQHKDFHTSPGADIPGAMETDWGEAVDSQQLSGSEQFAHAPGYVLLSLCQLPASDFLCWFSVG